MNIQDWNLVKEGDIKAFRKLFDEYYTSLCLYANTIINDLERSQDIVSDCFVKIWERKEAIRINSSIKYYLLLSVRNSIYSYLRSPDSRRTDLSEVIKRLEKDETEEYDLEKDEMILQVYKLIEELPEQRKTILELAAFKNKSYKEIAEILGISVNTVKTQMGRAYRFLREQLSNDGMLLWFFFNQKE